MKQLQGMLFAFLAFAAIHTNAQIIQASQTSAKITSVDFFKAEQPAELTILSDFKTLKSKKKKGVYQDAVGTLYLSQTDSISDKISICARGEFRRENCQMPSLIVNFKTTTPSPLSGLKKMKMVCGCSSSSYSERLVLLEYLTYRIFNFLTDMSFRTRLVKVNYRDVNDKVKTYSQYAFLIEDVDELAKRNGCREYEKKASSVLTNRAQLTLVAFFQYMIGNTDWSVPNYHNIKLIQLRNDSTSYPYVVPYDFDFAGIVNASYAFPNTELFGIEKVTDRVYRGHPRNVEELELTLKIFRDNKENILSLVRGFDLLDLKDRKTMTDYIEDFYSIINNPKRVKYEFVNGGK